jgi:hypothetical protein
MDIDTKSASPSAPGTQLQAASKKVFSSNEVPYPVYTNAVEFTGMGVDIFMDVGVVSPESLQTAFEKNTAAPTPTPTVDFNVLYRFGMTLQTALQLHQRLSDIITATRKQLETGQVPPVQKKGG